jgi:P27 family predicted phage terminase small subunit
MGRNRKPLEVQINEGDPGKRGKRKLSEAADRRLDPPEGLPNCPFPVKGRARSAWKFLSQQLEQAGLDRRIDAFTLEALCLSYAAAVAAEEQLTKEGCTVREDVIRKGIVVGSVLKTHPAVKVRNAAWSRFLAFGDRFGLSPRAREAITTQPLDNSEAELMRILTQPRPKRTEKELQ